MSFVTKTGLRAVLAVSIIVTSLAACGDEPDGVEGDSIDADSAVADTSSTSSTPEIMPDLVGQSEEDARAVLAPLNVQVTSEVKIAPEPEGTVIDQDPVAGSKFSQRVTLVVSISPPVVPDVTGQTFGTAEATLLDLGFTVEEKPVFDGERVDGLVIEQEPPAGSRNAGEVILSVVRRPVVAYLSDMEPVTYVDIGYSNGTAKSNGKTYPHGVLLEPYSEGVGSVEYDLSRQYRRAIGQIGLEDQTSSDAQYKVEMYGDGRLLTEVVIDFGTTTDLEVDVTDVLRLKVTAAALTGEGGVVLGDFRAEGLESEVTVTPSPAP